MLTSSNNLHAVIDMNKWQDLQDSLAKVTEMAVITVDYKGIPISKHSGCQQFCQLVRADAELSRHCQRCDSRGGLEATRLGQPYIYLCHMNVVDAAIPIIVDDKYLGAIMAGQVLLSSGDEGLEPISRSTDRGKIAKQTPQYGGLYEALPKLSLGRVKTIVELIFHLCNCMVGEAIEKNLALEMCAPSTQREEPAAPISDLTGYPLKSLENINRRISSAITNAYIRDGENHESRYAGSMLGPALDYIHLNKSESCSLGKMAELCHISPSYFSKLFKKEIGENYSAYLARLKISWAKKLLETTQHPVSQICGDVGFHDACYFIKIFRKQEGITPAQYRKHYKDRRD